MALYKIVSEVKLEAPVLVAALEGWVDAGGVATACASHMTEGAETFAVFDADVLFDYRARRPILDIVDGAMKEMTWPELAVRHVNVGGRDLLVLSGAEPDFRWKELAASLVDLVLSVGVVEAVSLGALPAAVPHTRPVPMLATASRPDLLTPEDRNPGGLLRVPAAAVNLLEMSCTQAGIPSVGFWAQIPHYVNGVYFPGMLALFDRLGRHLGVRFPVDTITQRAAEQRVELDALVAQRPEAKEYVERLEMLNSEQRIPTGDEIAAEIERFLGEARGDDEGPFKTE
ncbi:MAG: PAC2 family protein [Actinomycetota bacterium]